MGSRVVMAEYRTVRLPEELCRRAEKWQQGRFADLEALLVFMLEEIIKGETDKLDREEVEMVEQRLKDLGYI